ncbi:hypothetical protein FRB94_003364 [Tulasnella sp. JGI-2019a]|nr:hypothetical protein FRB93_007766 [Tulasnella sp. JGI-2019a]KAG9003103.1 hypothetical protein FRB94_003364 [Tulasnella sp. JGI-2019a]
MAGLKALSAKCRKLQKLRVPLKVGPELAIHRPYPPFCDGLTLDVRKWRVNKMVDTEEFTEDLAALAPLQWSKDRTPWLFLGRERKGVWKAVEEKLGCCFQD